MKFNAIVWEKALETDRSQSFSLFLSNIQKPNVSQLLHEIMPCIFIRRYAQFVHSVWTFWNLSLHITTFLFMWIFGSKREKQVFFSSGNIRISSFGERKSLYKLCFIPNTFNIIWSIIWMKSFSISNTHSTAIQSTEQMKKVFMNSNEEWQRKRRGEWNIFIKLFAAYIVLVSWCINLWCIMWSQKLLIWVYKSLHITFITFFRSCHEESWFSESIECFLYRVMKMHISIKFLLKHLQRSSNDSLMNNKHQRKTVHKEFTDNKKIHFCSDERNKILFLVVYIWSLWKH